MDKMEWLLERGGCRGAKRVGCIPSSGSLACSCPCSEPTKGKIALRTIMSDSSHRGMCAHSLGIPQWHRVFLREGTHAVGEVQIWAFLLPPFKNA